jgi:hypothetical protein
MVYEKLIFPVERSWGLPVDAKGKWRTRYSGDHLNSPIIWDGLVDPILPIHIEVFLIRGDTCECWYPDMGWEIKDEEGRKRMERIMEVTPSPAYRTEDGRIIWQHRPMYHPHDECYILMGTDPNNPLDLGGEAHIWLGLGDRSEEHTITKPSLVWIPKGLVHSPNMFKNVRKPFFQIIVVPDHPTVVEYGVNEWPPNYKPFPPKPEGAIDLKTVKLIGPKPTHRFTFP